MNLPTPQNVAAPLFGWIVSLSLLALGAGLMAICWQEWLSEPAAAACFQCESGRLWLIRQLGGRLAPSEATGIPARVPFENVFGSQVVFTLLWWLGGGYVLSRRMRRPFGITLLIWGSISSVWWLIAGSWTVVRLLLTLSGWTSAVTVINFIPEMWLSFASAGWMTSFLALAWRSSRTQGTEEFTVRVPWTVWASIAVYTLIFGILNTLLYRNLLVPHGDSAMYEEHLWNLLHGHGFRSFIDKGLFLGEHIQVIHLGLIPLYLFWPSHLLLEWSQSFCLALGAIPIYLMTMRQTGSRQQSMCLSAAYLLYVPMQRLDLSIDFKTFRPEAFGIPLLLATLNALEGRNWKSMACWLLLTVLVKEDYALIFGPLGMWMALSEWRAAERIVGSWKRTLPGLLLAAGSVGYLALAVKLVIPYFKGGVQVHYASYFSKFGSTTDQIVVNLLTRPGLLWNELVCPENFLFAASLVLPLALLSLLSPGRLAVGLPLFVALGLNDIARNAQHHFHAPLVAIVFWAAAASLRTIQRISEFPSQQRRSWFLNCHSARFMAIMSLFAASGYHFWHGYDPGGLPFWDSASRTYWRKKYVQSERARVFPAVLQAIPTTARLAATDFAHTRFNHHARCYDYSGYRPNVPDDAEFLVIDVHGPYSTVKVPSDVDEVRKHPGRWELLPDSTRGYFLVFRRIRQERAE